MQSSILLLHSRRFRLGLRRRPVMIVEIALGALFLWAATWKWAFPAQATELVIGLGLAEHATIVVRAIAALEWGLGLWLLAGVASPWSRMAAGSLLIMFCAFLAYGVVAGVESNCGCFGLEESLQVALVRNGVLLSLLAGTFMFEGTPAEDSR